MKAFVWFRVLAGVLTPPRAGSPAAAVYATMGSVHFPAMGTDRTYGELHRGLGLFTSLAFGILALLAWQLSAIGRRDPNQAVPMAATLLAACVGSAILSWE